MTITEITPATDRSKSRKFKAILAGGLVLGLGAAVTLAAWNDSEFATGTFGTGHFDIEGSTDGVDFGDHPSSTPAALTVAADFPSLSPNAKVAKAFALRVDKDTDYDATVAVSSSATLTGTTTNNFTYQIVRVASVAACDATTSGQATIVGDGTAFGAGSSSNFTLPKSTNVGTDAGAPVILCIQVSANGSLEQDTSLGATWEFAASIAP